MLKFGKIAVLFIITIMLASCASRNKHYDPYSSHHREYGFRNVFVAEKIKKRGVMQWLKDLSIANQKAGALKHLPEHVEADLQKIHNPDQSKIQITWVGHATFLVQYAGFNILTDPVFSDRVSPLPFIGPTRWSKKGIELKDLPPIDIVIVSHNHYDHLDVNTIRMLGNKPIYMVPLGVKDWFDDLGNYKVRELDWWDTVKVTGFDFTFVPAQHISGRKLYDLNDTLWGGWVINKKGKKVYFAGDTGYSRQFKEIGARLGPFDLSFIPIGAYAPRDILKAVHVGPEEAVKIHQDVRSKQSIAMHWGTFRLTTEPLSEPPILLRKALKESDIDKQEFITVKLGDVLQF